MKICKLFLLLALCAFCSCKKTTFINSAKGSLSYEIQGGQIVDTISSDGEWQVESCPEWLKVEKQDSILRCVAEENKSGAIREGKITLVGGEVKSEIAVTQASICTRLNAANTSLAFEKEGGTQTVDIDTDGGKINVEVQGNMEANYDKGKLTVTAPANDAGTSSGKITLSCDEQKAEIAVTLKGSICPTCNGTGKVRCNKCGGRGSYDEQFDMPPFGVTYGCPKCGGIGEESWAGAGAAGRSAFRKGSGKMPCPTCGGKGS